MNRNDSPGDPRAFCDEIHPDDGLEAYLEFARRSALPRKEGRKARQLCKQVHRALSIAFGECVAEPMLSDMEVFSVEPAPNLSHLLVVIRPTVPTEGISTSEIRERVERVRGFLRSEVAKAITRKKAPELTFQVLGV